MAIVGQSGVGKSTLLHILGILDHPTSGTLRFSGEDVFAKTDAELAQLRNHSVGFVFQFHHLLPEFNALENVMMPGSHPRVGLCARCEQRAESMIGGGGAARTACGTPSANSRVASASVSRWRELWCSTRRFCSPMSPLATSIPLRASRFPNCCSESTAKPGHRFGDRHAQQHPWPSISGRTLLLKGGRLRELAAGERAPGASPGRGVRLVV